MVTLTVRKKDGSEVEVKASTLQIPAALHGDHSLTPRQVSISADINPATGAPYTQVGPRPATQISPPPSRRFDGRQHRAPRAPSPFTEHPTLYLSRPPIAPKDPSNSPSVKLHRGKGNETTMMVKDRDDSTRHPVTKQWLSRFQNQQSDAPATPVADSTEKGMFTAGRK